MSARPRCPPRRPARTCATTCRRSSPSAGHRLGPLRARRGPGRPDARTRSSTTTGSAARSRGSSTSPPTGGALLVSNHAGALPPDASMIAKAIQEEHPRPRPLHLTVEHFFKGYPVLRMFVAKIGGVPAHPGQRAPPAARRAAARARLPRGRARGPRSSTRTATGCAASGAAASSRRRCGPACRSSRSPSSAPRRRCRPSPRSACSSA